MYRERRAWRPVLRGYYATGESIHVDRGRRLPIAVDCVRDKLDKRGTGTFVRRAGNGHGAVKATGVTAVLELARRDTPHAELRAFGIEMGYVAEGPFCLGSGLGGKFNEFHVYVPPDPNRPESEPEDPPPYIVKSAAAVSTGKQPGKLWAHGLVPEDNGEIPAPFPNGYAAFYCI